MQMCFYVKYIFLSHCDFCKVRCTLLFIPLHIWPQGTLLSFHLFFSFPPENVLFASSLTPCHMVHFCFFYYLVYKEWTFFKLWSICFCNIFKLFHIKNYFIYIFLKTYSFINVSPLSNPVVTEERKNFLKQHGEGTSVETRLTLGIPDTLHDYSTFMCIRGTVEKNQGCRSIINSSTLG